MLTRCLDVAPSSRLPLNGSGCSFSTLLTRSPPARRGAADLRSVAHPLLRSARNTVLRSWCGDRQTTKLSSFSRHRHHHSPSRRGFGPNASRESVSNVSGDCALANLRSLQFNQHCAVDSIARETRPSMPTWSTDARTCSAPSTMPETRHAKNIPAREFQRSSPTRSRHPAQSNSGVGGECRSQESWIDSVTVDGRPPRRPSRSFTRSRERGRTLWGRSPASRSTRERIRARRAKSTVCTRRNRNRILAAEVPDPPSAPDPAAAAAASGTPRHRAGEREPHVARWFRESSGGRARDPRNLSLRTGNRRRDRRPRRETSPLG
jgi:hypothetical protein